MDRAQPRHPDHPDLADRLGPGLARLARREAQSAALRGARRRGAARASAYAARPPRKAALRPASEVAQIRYPEGGRPVLVTAGTAEPGEGAAAPPAPMSGSIPRDAARARQRVERVRPGPGHARPPRHMMVPGWGRHDRRLGRRVHVRLLPDRHLAVVADHRLASGAASAGSGRIRPTPISTTRSGFWILLPLAMLTFTGFWISFPSVFGNFEPRRPKPADRRRARRCARSRSTNRERRRRGARVARRFATGPAGHDHLADRPEAEWKIAFARAGRPGRGRVDDATGEVTPPRRPGPRPTPG